MRIRHEEQDLVFASASYHWAKGKFSTEVCRVLIDSQPESNSKSRSVVIDQEEEPSGQCLWRCDGVTVSSSSLCSQEHGQVGVTAVRYVCFSSILFPVPTCFFNMCLMR